MRSIDRWYFQWRNHCC